VVHERHRVQRKGRVSSRFEPKDYSGYRFRVCGCAISGVMWSLFSTFVGPLLVLTLNCIKCDKTWRDCLIVFVSKKFVCQSNE
jgi:hypothetical protein